MFDYIGAGMLLTWSYEFKHICNSSIWIGNSNITLGLFETCSFTTSMLLGDELQFDKERDMIEFFFEIDYLLYVPFGRRGMKQVKSCLTLDSDAEYVKHRTDKYIEMLTGLGQKSIPDDFIDSATKFCTYLTCNRQDLSVPESAAATARLVFGEFENIISKSEDFVSQFEFAKGANGILKKICDHVKEHGPVIDLTDFISFDSTPLNEEEIKIFEEFTNLKV
ncbi:MAG: hypothetical protein ACI4VK_00700 [Candidatus Coproplasma sp.]